jgi:hypothetical protein
MTRKCRQIAEILKDKAYAGACLLGIFGLSKGIPQGLWHLCNKIALDMPPHSRSPSGEMMGNPTGDR